MMFKIARYYNVYVTQAGHFKGFGWYSRKEADIAREKVSAPVFTYRIVCRPK